MRQILLGFAFIATSTCLNAAPSSEYTREGCWYYCDVGVVVTVLENTVLSSAPPWQDQGQTEVGRLKKTEKVLVVRAQTHGTPARLIVKEAKYGFVPTDEVWVFAYTAEWTYALKHNGKIREWVELGVANDPCPEDSWCEMIGTPRENIWVYVETSTKIRGWMNYNKLLSPKW